MKRGYAMEPVLDTYTASASYNTYSTADLLGTVRPISALSGVDASSLLAPGGASSILGGGLSLSSTLGPETLLGTRTSRTSRMSRGDMLADERGDSKALAQIKVRNILSLICAHEAYLSNYILYLHYVLYNTCLSI